MNTTAAVFSLTYAVCFTLGCASEKPVAVVAAPPRPAAVPQCQRLPAGSALQPALDAAPFGTAFCLMPGVHVGPITVPEGITVWGDDGAVIKTDGSGTTVLLKSKTQLLGVTVDGSGGRFDVLDAAVKVNGDDVTVEGVTVKNSVFGVLVEKSRRVTVRHNVVLGVGGDALGLRGDGIRLWETNDSVVEHNVVRDARDCVIWYSSHNRFAHNDVQAGRYGVHLMYSHENHISSNQFIGNEVGIFAMYSRNLVIEDNAMHFSRGAAGIGLGMKESGNLTVRRNHLAHNTQGLFLDNSPLNPEDKNLFEDNMVQLSDVGIGFLSSQHDNTFRHNHFKDNTAQVRVDGGGDALAVQWLENEWSDYVGYDLDGDGVGDLPYELKSLSESLTSRHADLAFFRGSPALALVSVAGEVAPLFAPQPVLRDERPLFSPQVPHAN